MWLRDEDGRGGEEAEWVMLFMKCTENKCVPDCRKCKKCKKNNQKIFFIFQNVFHFFLQF